MEISNPEQAPPTFHQHNPNESQQPRPLPPNNYLAWAILTTIFCCMPLGIVSIVYSSRVNNLWLMGHYDAARDTARKAKRWAVASLITTILGAVLYGLFVALGLIFSLL